MSELPPEHRNLIPGYELIRKLGQGGMGAVFQARQLSMDRMVALKVLPRNLAKQEKFKERFFREARAAGRLNHPNIVQALDAQEAGGYSYLAMELVQGVSLQKYVKEHGRLPEREALQVARQIADALDHAWTQHKIVHRDIKPENILYTKDRVAKLCDMGIARIGTDAALTQEGATIGTPSYISPEQARGSHDIDTRADIYSLGATLFHLLTGETPYQGKTAAAIIIKHIKEPIPSVQDRCPDISPGTAALVTRMMQKAPDDRYQTTAEVVADIDRLLAGKSPRQVSGRQTRLSSVRLPQASVAVMREKVAPYALYIRYGAYAVGGLVFLWTLVGLLRMVFTASPTPDPSLPPLVAEEVQAPPSLDELAAAAWEQAESHEHAGRLADARSAYHDLAQRFPRSEFGQRARGKVTELDDRLSAPDAPEVVVDARDDEVHEDPSRPGGRGRGNRERAAREALQKLRGGDLPPSERLALLKDFVETHAGTQAAGDAQKQIDQLQDRQRHHKEREVREQMQARRLSSIRDILEGGDETRILAVFSGLDGDARPLRPLAGSLERLTGHAGDATVREKALRLLVRVDREAGERAVREGLQDRNEQVRLAAVALAKEHRVRGVREILSRMEETDPSPLVREAIK